MRSDAELVNAVLAGERESFATLVSRYERAVLAETLAVLRDYHRAQDVAQEAFVAAFERLAGLREPRAFGSWLLQIARRRALDAAQRQSGRQAHVAAERSVPANNGLLDEASRHLLTALGRLPEHERIVIVLNYFESKKVGEIAQITHRPVGTVTVQLSRARARLREMLKEFEP